MISLEKAVGMISLEEAVGMINLEEIGPRGMAVVEEEDGQIPLLAAAAVEEDGVNLLAARKQKEDGVNPPVEEVEEEEAGMMIRHKVKMISPESASRQKMNPARNVPHPTSQKT